MSEQEESAYAALAAVHDDARWAFGTGFDDPLSGVDTALPSGVDGADLAAYCLMLGDDALVPAHRLAPVVERRADVATALTGEPEPPLIFSGTARKRQNGGNQSRFFRFSTMYTSLPSSA